VHSLQKQFHDFIDAHQLVKKGDKVLLAVSGGLDSMVMANLFLWLDVEVSIAHCNFGLRGQDSDEDEAFVLQWADQYNLNCYVKSFEMESESIQLEARNARYTWFGELLREHELHKLATAHHLDDSLETTLLNLSRGTGIRGVSGIPIENGSTIRPLLFTTKSALHSFAMDQGIEWREDVSNQKTDYDRNLIRHEVIPVLQKLNPSLEQTFFNTSERLSLTAEILKVRVEEIRSELLVKEADGWKLDLGWISKRYDELILSEILSAFDVNYVTCKKIFNARDKSGKSFETESWLITIDRSFIYIDPNQTAEPISLVIKDFGTYDLGSSQIVVEEVPKDNLDFNSSDIGFMDAERVLFPLEIRTWRDGDRFNPFGMKGEKKVSDFLIDEKVPLSKKREVLVLEADGRITWILGHRLADYCKVTEQTNRVIKVEITHSNN